MIDNKYSDSVKDGLKNIFTTINNEINKLNISEQDILFDMLYNELYVLNLNKQDNLIYFNGRLERLSKINFNK